MNSVKSKQRVADHGEVFTPPWMVEAMLDLYLGKHEIFTPAKSYPPMTVSELAAAPGDAPTDITPGLMHQVGDEEGLKA
jgi:hypothetical protein